MLIVHGRTQLEIAAELKLGATTVNTYVARIRQKFGARSINEIVQYAHRHRLIE